jgi:hypothetical protein
MLADRQHGNDDIGVFDASFGIGHDLHAVASGRSARCRHDVEAAHMLAGLDQIRRHGTAHVSETDESDIRHVRERLCLICEIEFQVADRAEVTVDDVGRDTFRRVRAPARIAVFVDDLRADALDEIVPGNAGQRDAIVLPKAFFQAFEGSTIAHIAERYLEQVGDQGGERSLRRIILRGGEAGNDAFDIVGTEARVDPGSRRFHFAGRRRARVDELAVHCWPCRCYADYLILHGTFHSAWVLCENIRLLARRTE